MPDESPGRLADWNRLCRRLEVIDYEAEYASESHRAGPGASGLVRYRVQFASSPTRNAAVPLRFDPQRSRGNWTPPVWLDVAVRDYLGSAHREHPKPLHQTRPSAPG